MINQNILTADVASNSKSAQNFEHLLVLLLKSREICRGTKTNLVIPATVITMMVNMAKIRHHMICSTLEAGTQINSKPLILNPVLDLGDQVLFTIQMLIAMKELIIEGKVETQQVGIQLLMLVILCF